MKKTALSTVALATCLAIATAVVPAMAQHKTGKANPMDPNTIAVDAYIYLYPLVTMDVTRLQMTNVPRNQAKGIQGSMNEFHHFRAFPDVQFRTVVRPNFDTLYSTLWADMTKEPLIVSVPASGGR